jgi:Family of unknown function (DUF5681)
MSKKSGRGNPPKHSRFKKGVSGNPKGRPPKSRKDRLVIDIISEFRNILTAYREGGHAKRASRLELMLKKLVNSALEGDARSAEVLFKLRAKASKSSGAKSQKFIVEDWVPDFEGQTGEQKTRAHARENEIDLTDPGEEASWPATDPPGSPSPSPNASRDE